MHWSRSSACPSQPTCSPTTTKISCLEIASSSTPDSHMPPRSLTRELLESQAVPLPEALQILRQYLPRHAVLVGQSIGKDIEWLQLREGQDYQVRDAARPS